MKKLRIIFILLTLIWMIWVFHFSNQPSIKSENTSMSVTKIIAKVIYGDNPNVEEKTEKLDPIIRKLAHYTLYLCGGILITSAVFTYKTNIKNKIIISQVIRYYICNNRRNTSILCSRKKCTIKRYHNRFNRSFDTV